MQDLLIKFLADYAVVPVVLIASYALVFKIKKGKRFESYCRILMAGLTAYFLAKMIGQVFQPMQMRPFEQLGLEAGASFLNNPGFPSDHMLFVCAITCAVWFETRQKNISIILLTLSLMIGIGRIMALVHSPIDIIGGILISLAGAVWYTDINKNIV